MQSVIPQELLNKVSPLLQAELSTDLEELRCQLTKLEACRHDLSWERTRLLQTLMQERERARMPKAKDYTELDRKTMLGASTSLLEGDYQFIESLEVIVKERLELGIALLQTF